MLTLSFPNCFVRPLIMEASWILTRWSSLEIMMMSTTSKQPVNMESLPSLIVLPLMLNLRSTRMGKQARRVGLEIFLPSILGVQSVPSRPVYAMLQSLILIGLSVLPVKK